MAVVLDGSFGLVGAGSFWKFMWWKFLLLLSSFFAYVSGVLGSGVCSGWGDRGLLARL